MNGITSSQNIPNPNTGVQETQNPKQIQGETQMNGKKMSVKLMDDSFSQKNTTENKMTFLNDAKHLHQRREVHEKGILHANYEGKGFFGSIGQFFKNIILCLEKNDPKALANICNEEYAKYADAWNAAMIRHDKTTKKQLSMDIGIVFSRLMTIADPMTLPEVHPLKKAVENFRSMNNLMTKGEK